MRNKLLKAVLIPILIAVTGVHARRRRRGRNRLSGSGHASDGADTRTRINDARVSRTTGGRTDHTPRPASTGESYTGGAIRPRRNDYEGQERWAKEAYEHFRQNDDDVDAIANNTGLPRDDVLAAKNNVMRDEHLIRDRYDGTLRHSRFDEDADIAAAWNRLRTGQPNPPHESDLALLNHEVAEAQYFQNNPGSEYAEAHEAANQESNWEQYVNSESLPYTREDYTAPNNWN